MALTEGGFAALASLTALTTLTLWLKVRATPGGAGQGGARGRGPARSTHRPRALLQAVSKALAPIWGVGGWGGCWGWGDGGTRGMRLPWLAGVAVQWLPSTHTHAAALPLRPPAPAGLQCAHPNPNPKPPKPYPPNPPNPLRHDDPLACLSPQPLPLRRSMSGTPPSKRQKTFKKTACAHPPPSTRPPAQEYVGDAHMQHLAPERPETLKPWNPETPKP